LKRRTPIVGSVDSVFAKWNSGAALVYKNTGYAKNPSTALPRALFELTVPVPVQQISTVVSQIRHAAMLKNIPAISGHEPGDRLAIYPLPTLDWNDDMVRRVVISSADPKLVKIAASRAAGLHLINDKGEDRG